MEDVIKTLLGQWGAAGALMVAMGFYLVKREIAFQAQQRAWDEKIEARHKEVLALTEKSITAIVEVRETIEDCKQVIARCQLDRGTFK